MTMTPPAANSTADDSTEMLARPQPVGVFPLPAGYLLIDDRPEHDEARAALVAGNRPAELPESLRYYQLALEGDFDGALAAIIEGDHSDGIVAKANRLVLEPDRALLAELQQVDDAAFRAHVDTIAFIVGLSPTPPEPTSTDGEFAALAFAAQATQALERSDTGRAIDQLEEAAQAAHTVSKAMAGQYLGQMATTQLDEGGAKRASVTFQAALDALEGSDLFEARAELHVGAGAMFQEMTEAAPHLMQQAINHYHQAMALVTAETSPETFAVANANLGLAYMMMPMNEASDQLRMGVAVQSMRVALDHFTPETHPDRWSSTQLNLANALVYMPSKHQGENIAEAVGLYEGVLQHRDRETDPLGRARVLANQGNAIAHLGVFDDAKFKLHEARAIFEEFEDDGAVMMVRSILDEIAKHESLVRQDADGGEGQ